MTRPTQKADKRKRANASDSDSELEIITKKSKATTSKVSREPVFAIT